MLLFNTLILFNHIGSYWKSFELKLLHALQYNCMLVDLTLAFRIAKENTILKFYESKVPIQIYKDAKAQRVKDY